MKFLSPHHLHLQRRCDKGRFFNRFFPFLFLFFFSSSIRFFAGLFFFASTESSPLQRGRERNCPVNLIPFKATTEDEQTSRKKDCHTKKKKKKNNNKKKGSGSSLVLSRFFFRSVFSDGIPSISPPRRTGCLFLFSLSLFKTRKKERKVDFVQRGSSSAQVSVVGVFFSHGSLRCTQRSLYFPPFSLPFSLCLFSPFLEVFLCFSLPLNLSFFSCSSLSAFLLHVCRSRLCVEWR